MKLSFVKIVIGAAVGVLAFAGGAQAGECANKDEILALFGKWNASLQTGNPEAVAEMYSSKEGVLLPTVSNKVRTSRETIADYFKEFLKLKPNGTLNESHVTCYGDIAINQGVYTFNIVRDGAPAQVQARYSYVYHKEDSGWKIVSHHSSRMPEPPK
ncbi:MAG: SgcJ/EcaC family oxidoreductase [Rhodospirillaceae bacterium]